MTSSTSPCLRKRHNACTPWPVLSPWITWADLDGSNTLTTRYLNGPDFGAPAARQTSGGVVSWYSTDLTGSVRAVLDNSGAITQATAFDAFGNITSGSLTDRFGPAQLQRDSITGFNVSPSRMSDPGIGRWTSLDPLGFAAGDANPYRDRFNAPTNYVDPNGLQGVDGGAPPGGGQQDGTLTDAGGQLTTMPDQATAIRAEIMRLTGVDIGAGRQVGSIWVFDTISQSDPRWVKIGEMVYGGPHYLDQNRAYRAVGSPLSLRSYFLLLQGSSVF